MSKICRIPIRGRIQDYRRYTYYDAFSLWALWLELHKIRKHASLHPHFFKTRWCWHCQSFERHQGNWVFLTMCNHKYLMDFYYTFGLFCFQKISQHTELNFINPFKSNRLLQLEKNHHEHLQHFFPKLNLVNLMHYLLLRKAQST